MLYKLKTLGHVNKQVFKSFTKELFGFTLHWITGFELNEQDQCFLISRLKIWRAT